MNHKHRSLTRSLLAASIALGLAANVQAANVPSAPAAGQSDAAAAGASQQQGDTQASERDEQSTELEAIVVTARLRAEPLEKVPMAISSFGPQDLRNMQAVNIADLQGAVPNLNIVQGRGSANSVNIFIRGIGQPDALQTFDPGVGFYVDGVYYSRINGALMKLFDIDHVEVLRGPQGTLYGMNTIGGAVKVITKKPGEFFHGSVGLTLGNYGRINTSAYLTGPWSDTLSWSIAAGTFHNDGYVTDPASGRDFNGDDTKSVRAKLDFHPSDSFNAVLSLDYTNQSTGLTMGHPTAPLVSTDLLTGKNTVLLLPGEWDYHAQTSFGPDQGQKMIHKGIALHMDWELDGPWSFKSISAYRKLDTESYIDIDATRFQLGDVLVALDQNQLSQEFQLHYAGDSVHGVFGLYYLDENVGSHQEAYADDFLTFAGIPIDFLRTIDDDLENKSYAAFVNGTWEFGDGWSLSGGLRFTRITKDYDRTTSTFFGAPLSAANDTFAFTTGESWNALTPALVLQKQFTPQLMWYASAKRGFKAGGFNGRANSAANVSSFDPEYVWTYESGMKFRSADGRIRASGDVFYSDYQDFQARVSEVTNPDDPIPSFGFPVLNAAALTMYGAEFQSTFHVGDNTMLRANLGYLHAQYDKFVDPRVELFPTLAGLHEHVAFAPQWTARVAATHSFDLSNGATFTVGGNYSWRDKMWLSVDNRPGLMQDAYGLAGVFGAFTSPSGSWHVRAGVRNVTDEVYKTDAQEFSSVANIQTAYFGWPRNYYVTLRYDFF